MLIFFFVISLHYHFFHHIIFCMFIFSPKYYFLKRNFWIFFFVHRKCNCDLSYCPFIVALQRSSHAHHDHSLSLLFFFAIFLSSFIFCACYAITKFKNLWLSQECQPATHLTLLDGANEWSEFVVALINLQEGIAVDRCLR